LRCSRADLLGDWLRTRPGPLWNEDDICDTTSRSVLRQSH